MNLLYSKLPLSIKFLYPLMVSFFSNESWLDLKVSLESEIQLIVQDRAIIDSKIILLEISYVSHWL